MSTPLSYEMNATPPVLAESATAVERTISEDRGAGHAAHAQCGFAMLAAGQAAPTAPAAGTQPALLDYQMQLMLLEWMNKKGLTMDLRKQKFEQEPGQAPTAGPGDRQAQLTHLEQQNMERLAPVCKDQNSTMEEDGRMGSQPGGPAPETRDPAAHVQAQNQHAGFRHNTLYLDVSALRNARSPPVAFIAYRPVYCPHANPTTHSPAGLGPRGEVISVVSPELQATMQRISKFFPNEHAYSSSGVRQPRVPGSLLSQSPSEYSPYFLYHHRDALRGVASAMSCAPEVKALWSYLQHNPDPMWSKCDELFAKGRVSAETLPWLFQPNEVVLYRERHQDIGCVLRRPPSWGTSHSVNLDCWHWCYDGQAFRQEDRMLTLTAPMYDTVPITDLAAYPLRFAGTKGAKTTSIGH
jgi:hypothetical protein